LKEMLFSSDGYAKLIGRNANAKGMVGRAPFCKQVHLGVGGATFFGFTSVVQKNRFPSLAKLFSKEAFVRVSPKK
jgi:hypothetical protein